MNQSVTFRKLVCTSLKSNCLVVGEDKLVKLALSVRQHFNLNFDTSFVKIEEKKLTEL